MTWIPNNPGWWQRAVQKASPTRSLPLQPSETNHDIAMLHVARAIARTDAEKARIQVRLLLSKPR